MAPEQLAGQASSIKSDLYALGLVLYELFTGKPAFHAGTLPELVRLQTETTPTSPSRIVEGFDPAVERVILRCLEKEPRDRPSSALAIAAALPGGNPLAAALAAGETPSPELVAEAGDVGGLAPPLALACLATIVAAVVGVIALSGNAQLTRVVSPEKPPDALVERARDTLASWVMSRRQGQRVRVRSQRSLPRRHRRPRHQPVAMADAEARSASRSSVLVSPKPSLSRPAELRRDRVVGRPSFARQRHVNGDPGRSGSTATLRARAPAEGRRLGARGRARLEPVVSGVRAGPHDVEARQAGVVPPFFVDQRAAWEGAYPEAADVPIHVEAAAYRGTPVYFLIATSWSRPERMQVAPAGRGAKISQAVALSVFLSILVGGSVLARSNLRLGRGDRKGAFRLAAYMMAVQLSFGFLETHHVPDSAELQLFIFVLARALYVFCLYWVFYIALEPYLRRLWPHFIVSWVRILNGRFRDPLVGRDLLIGVAVGALLGLSERIFFAAYSRLGLTPPNPATFFSWSDEALTVTGLRGAFQGIVHLASAPAFTLYVLVALLLLRLILRRQAPAFVAWAVLGIVINARAISSGNIALGVVYLAVFVSVWMLLLLRVGMVASMAMLITLSTLESFPMTLEFSAWYASTTLLAFAVVFGLAGFAFHTSLAGRPVFGDAK
jgi:serine/threonine-protein kinase